MPPGMRTLTAIFMALVLLAPTFALAQSEGLMPVMVTAGDLLIENPWTRATPPGAPSAGAYLRITNNGSTTEHLSGATSTAAQLVQFHEMRVADGIMMMSELGDGLDIAPGETVTFAPSGFHLMLVGLAGPIDEAATIEITLEFQRAGPVTLQFPASRIGGTSPYSDGMGGGHEMSPAM